MSSVGNTSGMVVIKNETGIEKNTRKYVNDNFDPSKYYGGTSQVENLQNQSSDNIFNNNNNIATTISDMLRENNDKGKK